MKRTFLLGLTGSIGMGKSTTARMFDEAGVPVWDADAAVHRMYTEGGSAVAEIAKLAPNAIVEGSVDRGALAAWAGRDPANLAALEEVVHPLVAQDRAAFISNNSADILVFDIPLLFETGAEGQFDAVAVVSVPERIQELRVLERPGMTRDKFEMIKTRQMPDAEKRRRADYVIDTTTLETAESAVHDILAKIREIQNA